MDVSMATGSQQQQPSSSKKASRVLRSIMPKEYRRTATNEENRITQNGPLLPPDHSHNASRGVAEDVRTGRSSTKENTAPHKRSKSTVSLRSLGRSKDSDKEREKKARKEKAALDAEEGRKKPKKTKSTTSLRNLLTKSRSSKDLRADVRAQLDKENLTPNETSPLLADTPIWSQFATCPDKPTSEMQQQPNRIEAEIARYTPLDYSPSKQRDFAAFGPPTLQRPQSSGRPKSALLPSSTSFVDVMARTISGDRSKLRSSGSDRPTSSRTSSKASTGDRPTSFRSSKDYNQRPIMDHTRQESQSSMARKASSSSNDRAPPKPALDVSKRGSRVMAAVAALNDKANSAVSEPKLDAKVVDAAFEAVLESRNIPENMRQKMRTLTLRVKADFVKQDRGTATPTSPAKPVSRNSIWSGDNSEQAPIVQEPTQTTEEVSNDTKKSRTRSKTFTFSKNESSPTKKHKADARPTSLHVPKASFTNMSLPSPTATPGALPPRGPQPGDPDEFVTYLRKVSDPVKVEVSRLHKLRLLLRNETVAWVDKFISLGGMTEVVELLQRIMAIEWREEHEDQLLHETLLCLKGLCTTEVALTRLEDMADTLFQSLLALLFDEEKKGPSEFNTRTVIINILFAFLSATCHSNPDAMAQRARTVLGYLAGPKKPEEAQPIHFVLDMRQPRPYRIWCNEVNNVTREVFWIFLHHLNIIPLPKRDEVEQASVSDAINALGVEQTSDSGANGNRQDEASSSLAQTYTKRHFPGDRPPVPAAPYIGGVEWDATTYMTAHLDLLNGLIASLPTREERNKLRGELRTSGWERVMGGTLRTCKEKFYCGVHSGLQSWIAAALEDGWNIDYVRYGPTKEDIAAASPKKSPKKAEPAPQLDMPGLGLPKMSLGFGGTATTAQETKTKEADDGWLL